MIFMIFTWKPTKFKCMRYNSFVLFFKNLQLPLKSIQLPLKLESGYGHGNYTRTPNKKGKTVAWLSSTHYNLTTTETKHRSPKIKMWLSSCVKHKLVSHQYQKRHINSCTEYEIVCVACIYLCAHFCCQTIAEVLNWKIMSGQSKTNQQEEKSEWFGK